MTIYIGNLSFRAEREDLVDLFGQYGEDLGSTLAAAAMPMSIAPNLCCFCRQGLVC